MPRRPRLRFVTMLALLAAALVAAPEAGAQGWTPPQTLASGTSTITSPAVGANEAGRIATAWIAGGRVQARIRQGTTWGGIVTLSPLGVSAAEPTIAVANNGDVVLAWSQGAAGSQTLRASFFAAGRWSAPITLTPVMQRVTVPEVRFDGTNLATLVWSQTTTTGTCGVWSASARSTGGWSAPILLSTSGGCWSWVRLAVASNGEALCVFSNPRPARGGGEPVNAVSRSTSGGAWSAPFVVAAATYRSGSPSAAIAENGLAIVTWGDAYGPLWSRRAADGTWTPPAPIDDTGSMSYTGATDVAMDRSGNAVAAMGSFDMTFTYTPLRAARLGAGSNRFTLPGLITASPKTISSFQIAASAAGTFVVGWVDSEYDLNGNAYGAGVSTLPPGLGWTRTAFRAGDSEVAVAAARGSGAVLFNTAYAAPSKVQISTNPIP